MSGSAAQHLMNPATFRLEGLRNGGSRGWVKGPRGLPFNYRAGGLRRTSIPFEIVEVETNCTRERDVLWRRRCRTSAQHRAPHEGPWIGRPLVRAVWHESLLRCYEGDSQCPPRSPRRTHPRDGIGLSRGE